MNIILLSIKIMLESPDFESWAEPQPVEISGIIKKCDKIFQMHYPNNTCPMDDDKMNDSLQLLRIIYNLDPLDGHLNSKGLELYLHEDGFSINGELILGQRYKNQWYTDAFKNYPLILVKSIALNKFVVGIMYYNCFVQFDGIDMVWNKYSDI